MPRTDLDDLETICQRISLNIPEDCPWRWDKEFNLALTVIDRKDEIMVELPLTLEFSHKWDFATINDAEAPIRDFFQAGFGVVPGQKVFTMDPFQGVVLYAAWWPWGDDERISLRLGLVSVSGEKMDKSEVKSLICSWLNLE
ncbi:hypothetical protein DSCA_07760 [Desulfosarcina alkanivorans]|uniref:Uncharacterized protein n=1 Tax=Desulfosarcina alkanivorans TaxID=571177 RepID=A0A5K7YD20_9BACT|nr:hypothetical protein [Desulfosarcina alkanivorans]BBO66846.1 hypothetical protein DSCA_07760 [Desulfosarcina alkanivorans]